eukprot:scaffold676_cov316-Pavlova_lutheri.AAC.54
MGTRRTGWCRRESPCLDGAAVQRQTLVPCSWNPFRSGEDTRCAIASLPTRRNWPSIYSSGELTKLRGTLNSQVYNMASRAEHEGKLDMPSDRSTSEQEWLVYATSRF